MRENRSKVRPAPGGRSFLIDIPVNSPESSGSKAIEPARGFLLGPLIILTFIFTAASAVLALRHLRMSSESEMLWSLSTRLFMSCWVNLDRKGRRLSLPFEFDAFVFFAWPFALPYYLYKSRGLRGILLAAFIFALILVPEIVVSVLRIVG